MQNNNSDTVINQIVNPEVERNFQQLPNKALWQMRTENVLVRGLLWLLVIIAAYMFFRFFIPVDESLVQIVFTGLIILTLVMLPISWLASSIQYNYTAYYLDDTGLIIRKGMLWRSETYALRSRIQHIDVIQTPMDSIFGLATIRVYTAGTKMGSISLSGLNKDDAESIRDELISNKIDTL